MGEFVRLVVAAMVGAGISFGTTWFLERRREKTAAALAREQVARDLRRASRLVWTELMEIGVDVRDAVERRLWWSVPIRALPTDAWRDHRSTLAAHLDDATWETVALGYSSVQELNRFLDRIRETTTSRAIQEGSTRLNIHYGSIARATTELRAVIEATVDESRT